MKLAALIVALGPLQGCAALEAIGPLTSAYGAWRAHQAAAATARSLHCDSLPAMELSAVATDALTRADAEELLAYQRLRAARCGE